MEKNGKTKNIVLAVLLVAVLTLSIAYATLSAQLNISAQATVKNGQWNVQFERINEQTPICTAQSGGSATTASIVSGHEGTLNSTDFSGLQVEFKVPGDKVVCTWNVANRGTIDAKLATYNAPTVSLSGDDGTLTGKVLTTLKVNNATPVQGTDELPATSGNVKTVELTIQLDPNLQTLPSSDVIATVGSSTFTYQQK